VSLQVAVINRAVHSHYIPPGLRLPTKRRSIISPSIRTKLYSLATENVVIHENRTVRSRSSDLTDYITTPHGSEMTNNHCSVMQVKYHAPLVI